MGKNHACVLRPRRRPEPDQGQEGRHYRLWQPGPCPRAQSARFRRQGGHGRAAQRLARLEEGRGREASGQGSRRGRQMGRRDDDAHAGRAAGRHLPRPHPRQSEAGRGADVRPRPQHPFQPDRAAARPRRDDDRAEGPRPHRARRISARRRRAGADGGASRRVGQRPRSRRCPMARRSAAAAPASSRPRSARNARPTCSASRPCCAAVWSS